MSNQQDTIEQRRVKVAELYEQGYTQTYIATQVGVTQPTVYNDIQAIRKSWQQQYTQSINNVIIESLVRIEKVYQEAWEAWLRSQEDQHSTSESVELDRPYEQGGKGKGSRHESKSITKTTKVGDKGYLDTLLKCIDMRLKVVGGYAKDKREDRFLQELAAYVKQGRYSLYEVGIYFPEQAKQVYELLGEYPDPEDVIEGEVVG